MIDCTDCPCGAMRSGSPTCSLPYYNYFMNETKFVPRVVSNNCELESINYRINGQPQTYFPVGIEEEENV